MRLPYRQRLSLILNELGTGLAGRGKELNEVIRRADPALKEVDKVLKLLASQNKVLGEPRARLRHRARAARPRAQRTCPSAIEHSSNVAEATAERGDDLEADIERLPRFLQELRPTMRRLGALVRPGDAGVPRLGDAAPDINRMIRELGPFSEAGIPAVESLGDAAVIGTPAMRDLLPITKDLRRFAKTARPVGKTAGDVLESFKRGRGIQRLLDYTFYQVAAINGFDRFGHYLRARLILNTCSRYYTAAGRRLLVASFAARERAATSASAASAGRHRPDPRAARPPRCRARTPTASRRCRRSRRRRSRSEAGRSRRRRRPERSGAAGAAARHATPAPNVTRPGRGRPRLPVREGRADEGPRLLDRRQPGPDRRRHRARDHRGDVPVLQRQRRPAVRAQLPAQARGAERRQPGRGQRGADRRHARRRRRLDHRQAPRGRLERRADRPQARARGRSAAQGLDGDHPAEVGARPQVRRDHARHVRRRLRRRRHDPAVGVDARPRSSSTSS